MSIEITGFKESGPSVLHVAAFNRIHRLIADNADFVSAILKATPERREANFKYKIMKATPDFVKLKELWKRDVEFRTYLRERMRMSYKVTGDQILKVFLES